MVKIRLRKVRAVGWGTENAEAVGWWPVVYEITGNHQGLIPMGQVINGLMGKALRDYPGAYVMDVPRRIEYQYGRYYITIHLSYFPPVSKNQV